MNELQKVFDYQGAQVRTVVKDGQPYFVLKDVCEVLGIGNITDLRNRLNEKGLGQIELLTNGGRQMAYIINEANLYKAILRSDKPEARKFEDWVTEEVLPQIRQTGGYIPTNQEDTEEDILAKAVLIAQKTIDKKNQIIAQKDKLLEEVKPLVAFAETCMSSKDSIKVGELAKIASKNGIVIGQNRLWNVLRKWEHIIPSTTEPYQRYIDCGYYEVVQMGKEMASGARIFKVMRVTPKGQVYIMNRLRNERMSDAG